MAHAPTPDPAPAAPDDGARPSEARSTRVITALAALLLALTYFFPLWRISLTAPQYPEGLGMYIWTHTILGSHAGDLNNINDLNHYIGMKKESPPESIRELKIMPWVMRGMMLLGLAVAWRGTRRLLLVWLLLFGALALGGLVDFYLWGYDYGHHLDTAHAIIKVPGMSYQPPLIGAKKLLNFRAISLPGIGGWVAVGVFLTGSAIWVRGWWKGRKVSEGAH